MKRNIICTILGAITLMMVGLQDAHAGRGIFVIDQYYAPGPYYEGKAQNSGFTTLFLFTLQVNSNGDLRYGDNGTVASNGNYVGNGAWNWQLAGCRGGSVSQIQMSIGNWGTQSFNNIRNLINSQGTGSGSILYRNFRALQNFIHVDAYLMDDETTYDVNSMVSFCKMLTDGLGTKVSLCPYNNQGFWVNVKNQLPNGRVTGVWLQCYDGGAGNDANQWKSALGNTAVLFPGDWINDGGATVTSKASGWHSSGMTSAFIWADHAVPDPTWSGWLISGGF